MEQKTRKIAILGFDREGKSTLKFLQSSGLARINTLMNADKKVGENPEIWILDRNENIKVPRGVHATLGKHYLKDLLSFDLVFRTPGIPWMKPELVKARRAGVEFSSATKLFFEEAGRKNVHVIGITGTKGKGTTATILYKMLKAAGKKVFLVGNIGRPALDIFSKISVNPRLRRGSGGQARIHSHKSATAIAVLELSSFQLQDLTASPHTAVVLDIFPDHQDSHLNLREYYDAKTNIARHQKRGDRIFFFKNHPLSRWAAAKSRGKKIPVDEKHFRLFSQNDLRMPGYHNFKNAIMAATVARAFGVSAQAIKKAAKAFRGNEHRLEFVRGIDSVEFYNDSAATIPEPTAAAIASFPEKQIILIAGGRSKVANYAPLAKAVKCASVPLIVLYGENQRTIAKAIRSKNQEARIKKAQNLKAAVKIANSFAKSLVMSYKSSVIVLFSPASQSFDQFKNYADRGEQFKRIVKQLK